LTSDPALSVLATTAPSDSALGLYVHVPFCTQRCHFCSFNTAPALPGAIERYLIALHREIDLVATAPWASRIRFESVFLGGGTPSLLDAAQVGDVLTAIRSRFAVADSAEVTMECNPEGMDRARFAAYRAEGVTRISLGVQSLDDGILPCLGRGHTAAAARTAFVAARAAGLPQLSVDLMYGLPGLDAVGWADAVTEVLGWEPDHLSAYGLTLDPGSRWGSQEVAGLPSEDTVTEQYWTLARAAAARGYEHYEVSNYARPGSRSRHNQLYWQRREYVALGPGACGFLGDVRYANVRSVDRYGAMLARGSLPVGEHERLTERQRDGERLILGLRTSDGVPVSWLTARARGDHRLQDRLRTWAAEGLLMTEAGHAWLTERGFLLSDALFVELV
jgi:oxygen-independent coproporphyrinogen-3 oxidase